MMLSDEQIQTMTEDLVNRGVVTMTDANGQRLYLTNMAVLGGSSREFMLSYEGQGCTIFDTSRPVNRYRLSSAGFTLRVATVLETFLDRLFKSVVEKVGDAAIQEGLVPIGE